MSAHSVVRAVAVLAPGKRVSVIARRETYELPERPEFHQPAPDPALLAAKKILESDAQSRAMLESVGKNFADVFARTDETLASVAAGQAEVVESVRENTRTLHLPVRPVYDKDGKVIAAQRVEK